MRARPDSAGAGSARRSSRGGWVHFGVAAGLLLTAAVGFNAAVRLLEVRLVKEPVPCQRAKLAGKEGHWLSNFPERVGPYVLAPELELAKAEDGRQDGYRQLHKDMLKELGVVKHPLNWYFFAYYRDSRAGRGDGPNGGRYFMLDVTYYTGLVDPVPHVPEICMFAGGARLLSDRSGTVPVKIPDLPEAWQGWEALTVRRVVYAVPRGGRDHVSAQYYVFSMNGQPTDSRNMVRLKLMLPTRKYCYFAKVQVAMLSAAASVDDTDKGCSEFLRHAIPEVLKFLPSPEDVERLEQTGS